MENNEKMREELQDKFTLAFESEDIDELQKFYGKLKRINRNTDFFETESVDISDLAENICISADILLRENGKSVIFCGNDVSSVFGNRQILTKAILEAISNAILHGNSSLITIKLCEYKDYITLGVQNMGQFKFNGGEGIKFIRSAIKKLGGDTVILSNCEYSSVIFKLKKSGNICPSPNPNFIDLVCDRLSPVYIELYGV